VLEAADGGAAFMICGRYKKPSDLPLTDLIMPQTGACPDSPFMKSGASENFLIVYRSPIQKALSITALW